jgi:hypothetical protein
MNMVLIHIYWYWQNKRKLNALKGKAGRILISLALLTDDIVSVRNEMK